jgi:hypothetical protein
LFEQCLLQVRAELEATQGELRAAQVAIQERDYALATHARCEAALAGHAGALNAALAGAAADVALLFTRWDEKNGLEDANAALVQVRLVWYGTVLYGAAFAAPAAGLGLAWVAWTGASAVGCHALDAQFASC